MWFGAVNRYYGDVDRPGRIPELHFKTRIIGLGVLSICDHQIQLEAHQFILIPDSDASERRRRLTLRLPDVTVVTVTVAVISLSAASDSESSLWLGDRHRASDRRAY
jgi:hypothetical protein